MTALRLESVFQGRRIPSWLRRFEAEPAEALHDLLLGRAFLGHLNADEPAEVLLDWLENLGDNSEFPEEVDATLAQWIERNWGRFSRQAAGANTVILATAWTRVANLIAFEPRLSKSARGLRSFFPEQRSFLSALSEGRARDPEGRAWLAIAKHQDDRSLLLEWWHLCSLAPDVPWYHGAYGIHGLRGLPAERREREGTFAVEVAEGLARLASGLSQRVSEGWLIAQTARGEFLRTARLTMDAYPFGDRWPSFWRHTLEKARLEEDDEARSWIQALYPRELQKVDKRLSRGPQRRWMEPNPAWGSIAREVADRLRKMDLSAVDEAQELLGEQARYVELTGDKRSVVRSACNFAVLKTQGLLSDAESIYRETVKRFPENVVARNGLGDVLMAQGLLSDAGAIYRETVKRFPEDVFARNGLGDVLKARGLLSDAESIYRKTVERFPENVFARTGLGEVLKAEGRLPEAKEVYEEAVERFPQDEVARAGLERISKKQERTLDAEPPVSSQEASHPAEFENLLDSRDLVILLQDVYLLRRWALRSDRIASTPGDLREMARQKLKPLLRAENAPPEAVREYGLLSLDAKDLEEVLRLLHDAVKRYPGSARVRYTLACAEREAAARRGTLDRSNPEAPVLPWRRLARLDERFVPLQLIGEARTWLVQTDGSLVAEKARDCLGQLEYRIQKLRYVGADETGTRRDSPGFIPWWSQEIQSHVFGVAGPSDVEQLDLDVIQSNLTNNAGVLNRLEEDWLQHWARA